MLEGRVWNLNDPTNIHNRTASVVGEVPPYTSRGAELNRVVMRVTDEGDLPATVELSMIALEQVTTSSGTNLNCGVMVTDERDLPAMVELLYEQAIKANQRLPLTIDRADGFLEGLNEVWGGARGLMTTPQALAASELEPGLSVDNSNYSAGRLGIGPLEQSVDASVHYLGTVMDQFHDRFPVYDDVSSAGNHFHAFGKILNRNNVALWGVQDACKQSAMPTPCEQRFDEPRFIRSFTTLSVQSDPFDASTDNAIDLGLRNSSFVYDNATAILANLPNGSPDNLRRARLMADALVYAGQQDRTFSDTRTCDEAVDPLSARLRSAYAAGDIALATGWIPTRRIETVPTLYYEATQTFYEVEQAVTDEGNNVWWAMSGGNQAYSGSVAGTEFVSSGGQVAFCWSSGSNTSPYPASRLCMVLTDIMENSVADRCVQDYCSSATHTWVILTGVRERRVASEILEANDCGSDCEALDSDRNLLSEPYATIESIRSSLTSNSLLLESDAFAAASEASLFDSNTADAGGGHHALRAIAFTAARVIRRCGKRAEPNAPVKEGSDAVSATRYVDIGARIQPGPTKLLVCCATGKCLPGDVGRPTS